MQFTAANGITLHTDRAGAGPPIVFVNSLGSDFRIWDAVLPALTQRAAVIRYDKRGHGLSDMGPSPWTRMSPIWRRCSTGWAPARR
jgi:3-oxoadipate enol-lactonase